MRRLAQGITGALALALMVMRQPWSLQGCPAATCTQTSDETLFWVVFGVAVYVGFIGVIMTVVLVGVLGIRDSGRAADSAVLAALGQSQGSAVRAAALRGLKDGAVITGVAFVATAGLNVWIVLSAGYGLGDLNPLDFVARLVMVIGFTAMLVLAHVIDAARPRRTPAERLYEDAAAPRPRRVSLRLRSVVLGAVLAACVGILAGVTLAHDPATGDAGTIAQLLSQGALTGLTLTGIALFFAVGVPVLRLAIPPSLLGVAKAAGVSKATRASAILRARATTASGASARTVLAIAGLALLAGALCSADAAPQLSPAYVGTVTIQPASAARDVAAEFAALDGVGSVVLGTQFGEGPVAVGVDPDAVAAVDPDLYRLLHDHPGAVVTGPWMDEVSLDAFAGQGIPVTGIVPTSTCCTAFVDASLPGGNPTGAAILVYAAEGADPVAVANEVDVYVPKTHEVEGWGSSWAYNSGGQTDFWGAVFLWALVFAVCGGPLIALAVGVAARRRRDDATLAALGASRRTLTGVAVVETTVIAAIAVGGGLLGGALLQASLAVATRARDSLDGVITDSYLEVAVRSVAWDTLGFIYAGTVTVFALAAWIVTRLAANRLPVEQVRMAETGRIA